MAQAIGLKETNLNKPLVQENMSKAINRDSLFCTHCKKHRHTKERCWKLHGKPNRCSNDKGQANVASTQSNNEGGSQSSAFELNKEGIEKLNNFLKTLEKHSLTSTSSLAFSGISSSSLNSCLRKIFSKNMGNRFWSKPTT